MKVGITRLGNRVAPRFECSTTITIYTIKKDQVVRQVDFSLQSRQGVDRVRLLRDQNVDTLICGGVQSNYEDMLHARGIHTISWVSGEVDDLLARFLKGQLSSGRHQADIA